LKNEELEEEIESEQNASRAVHSRHKVVTRRDTDIGVHQQFVGMNDFKKVNLSFDDEISFLITFFCS